MTCETFKTIVWGFATLLLVTIFILFAIAIVRHGKRNNADHLTKIRDLREEYRDMLYRPEMYPSDEQYN